MAKFINFDGLDINLEHVIYFSITRTDIEQLKDTDYVYLKALMINGESFHRQFENANLARKYLKTLIYDATS
jgi:hypothetical protein